MPRIKILTGDVIEQLKTLPDSVINCVVTSPPYWGLRDYGTANQIGSEPTFVEYINNLREVFSEVYRVLRPDGIAWLNLGDSYNAGRNGGHAGVNADGLKPKDICGIPWRVAFALQSSGWYLRDEIVWAKPNAMPGSQLDRCTSAHESIFMLTKSAKYWSDFDAIKTPPRESTLVRTAQDLQNQAGSHRQPGKTNGAMKAVGGFADKQRGHSRKHAGFNERWDAMEKREQQAKPAMMRDVWFVSSGAGFRDKHFAVMPEEIARRCILAGCPENGIVLDPFGGSGTTAVVALKNNRNCVLIELNPDYVAMAQRRIDADIPLPVAEHLSCAPTATRSSRKSQPSS